VVKGVGWATVCMHESDCMRVCMYVTLYVCVHVRLHADGCGCR